MTPLALGFRLWKTNTPIKRIVTFVVLCATSTIALLGLAQWHLYDQPQARTELITPGLVEPEQLTEMRWVTADSEVNGQTLRVLIVEPQNGETSISVPGYGIPIAIGQAVVSPRLAEILQSTPSLAQRIPGQEIGILGESGLATPNSYYAVAVSDQLHGGGYRGAGWGLRNADNLPGLEAGPSRLIISLLVLLPCSGAILVILLVVCPEWARRTTILREIGASATQRRIVVALPMTLDAVIPCVIGGVIAPFCYVLAQETDMSGFDRFKPSVAFWVVATTFLVTLVSGVSWLISARASQPPSARLQRSLSLKLLPSVPIACLMLLGVFIVLRLVCSELVIPSAGPLIMVSLAACCIFGAGQVATPISRILLKVLRSDHAPDELATAHLLGRPTMIQSITILLSPMVSVAMLVSAVLAIVATDITLDQRRYQTVSTTATVQQLIGLLDHENGWLRVAELEGGEKIEIFGTCRHLADVYGAVQTSSGECADNVSYDNHEIQTSDGEPISLAGVATTISTKHLRASDIQRYAKDHSETGLLTAYFAIDREIISLTDAQNLILQWCPNSHVSVGHDINSNMPLVSEARLFTVTEATFGFLALTGALIVLSLFDTSLTTTLRNLTEIGVSDKDVRKFRAYRMLKASIAASITALFIGLVIEHAYIALATTPPLDLTGLTIGLIAASLVTCLMVIVGWAAPLPSLSNDETT